MAVPRDEVIDATEAKKGEEITDEEEGTCSNAEESKIDTTHRDERGTGESKIENRGIHEQKRITRTRRGGTRDDVHGRE